MSSTVKVPGDAKRNISEGRDEEQEVLQVVRVGIKGSAKVVVTISSNLFLFNFIQRRITGFFFKDF